MLSRKEQSAQPAMSEWLMSGMRPHATTLLVHFKKKAQTTFPSAAVLAVVSMLRTVFAWHVAAPLNVPRRRAMLDTTRAPAAHAIARRTLGPRLPAEGNATRGRIIGLVFGTGTIGKWLIRCAPGRGQQNA